MAFDILLPIITYPNQTQVAGLRRALDLASTLEARVTAVVQEVEIPSIDNALAFPLINVSGMILEAEKRSRSRGEKLTAEVTDLAGYFQLDLEARRLKCRLDDLDKNVVDLARTHDFAFVVHDLEGGAKCEITEAVIFGSGGPVVVFPGQETPAHLNAVAIAWDGSRAAARAVRDALPILSLARSVFLITVRDDKVVDAQGIAEVRRLLDHHEIENGHIQAIKGDLPIGRLLQESAMANDAGLLVMGAYGHNRVREFILGGATRGVLDHLLLPILMSH